jgi:superoxide dismutase, Cu-Zn family
MGKAFALGILVCLLVVAHGLGGCSRSGERGAVVNQAIAVLHATQGNKVQGVVSFTKERDGMHVVASVSGLSPGLHGFHLHEYGDCSSPDANSAGGHFNPGNMPHGGPTGDKRHAGDFGNIQADASGSGRLTLVDPKLSFDGPYSVLGRAVVVHAQADDFTSQPTGASGARVACGVVGIAKP